MALHSLGDQHNQVVAEVQMKGQTTCHCGCGLDTKDSHKQIMAQIEKDMQQDLGAQYQLVWTCGARCDKHNAEVGGAPNSAHTIGVGSDHALITGQERFSFIKACIKRGIKRLEDRMLGHNYMHADTAEGPVPHPTAVLSEYPQNVFIVLP
jgi:hypothetical protein